MTITSVALELPEGNFPRNSIIEQKLRHERRERRRLRRKGSQNQYHHTPCSAALDFARTTTPEPLVLERVHKLARPVMEYYTRESLCNPQQSQSLSPRFHELEPCSNGVAASKASDNQVLGRRISQRTLEISRYAHSSSPTSNYPLKTGGDLSLKNLHRVPLRQRRKSVLPSMNDRPDWTEQDECLDPEHPSIFDKVRPLIRRSESIWSIRHGTSKHVEGVMTHDDDSVLNMRKYGRFRYPLGCACFL